MTAPTINVAACSFCMAASFIIACCCILPSDASGSTSSSGGHGPSTASSSSSTSAASSLPTTTTSMPTTTTTTTTQPPATPEPTTPAPTPTASSTSFGSSAVSDTPMPPAADVGGTPNLVAGAGATAVVISLVTALIDGAGGGGAPEVQCLVVMAKGLTKCSSNPTVGAIGSTAEIIVVPFSFGGSGLGATFALFMIFILALLMNVAGAAIANSACKGQSFAREAFADDDDGTSKKKRKSNHKPPNAAEVLLSAGHCPSIALIVYGFVFPGLAMSAVASFGGDTQEGGQRGLGGTVFLLLCVLPVAGLWQLTKRHIAPRIEFDEHIAEDGGPIAAYPFLVRFLLLPTGNWVPITQRGASVARMFAVLVSPLRHDAHQWNWLVLFTFGHMLLIALISSDLIVTCGIKTAALMLENFASALFVAIVRPYRVGIYNVQFVAVTSFSFVAVILAWRDMTSGAATVVGVGAICAVICSIIGVGVKVIDVKHLGAGGGGVAAISSPPSSPTSGGSSPRDKRKQQRRGRGAAAGGTTDDAELLEDGLGEPLMNEGEEGGGSRHRESSSRRNESSSRQHHGTGRSSKGRPYEQPADDDAVDEFARSSPPHRSSGGGHNPLGRRSSRSHQNLNDLEPSDSSPSGRDKSRDRHRNEPGSPTTHHGDRERDRSDHRQSSDHRKSSSSKSRSSRHHRNESSNNTQQEHNYY